MQLQFIYKNNGKKYEIVEGANISMSYNEDLSNGIILLRESEPVDIEPYDEIVIYGLDYVEKLYMLIDTYVCKETRNKFNDKEYTYTINIMSQTKLLENKILPNLTITPKTNGGLKIIDYLKRYNDLYGQKVRTEIGFINKFSFSSECDTKFSDVCPELQFNNPTFRECLTQLMMVKNCIPIVQNNVIDFIDLSEKQELVDKDDPNIAYIETSQSSADYVSDLKMNMKNVIQNESYKKITQIIGFRDFNSAYVNTDTMKLYTQHPIYDIEKVIMCGVISLEYTKPGIPSTKVYKYHYQEIDVTNLFVEKSKWDTLITVYKVKPYEDYDKYNQYKNTTAYYTRGSNVIQNFNFNTTYGSIFKQTDNLVQLWFWGLGYKHFKDDPMPEGADKLQNVAMVLDINNSPWWNEVYFKITYKTKADVTIKIGKANNQITEREVVDNQNENYINAYTQGLLEYSKANRLGNKMKIYSGRFPRNYSELPVIGDYYEGNEIIYKIDYQIWRNAVDATIYACPNYVLRNYFTSVQSKLRSWRIVDGSEAFSREENEKYYLEFGYKGREDFIPGQWFINPTDKNYPLSWTYFLGPLADSIADVEFGIIKNEDAVFYVMEVFKNVCGNSLLYTFGFTDNYQFFRHITDMRYEGGSLQGIYSYVDKNGNKDYFKIYLINNSPLVIPFADKHEFETEEQAQVNGGLYGRLVNVEMPKSPKINDKDYEQNTRIYKFEKNYYKDNKEIMKFNFQFEYCSENDNIRVCEEFLKGQINKIDKNKLAIRLANGNVVSDILPTIVNDLPITDMVLDYENKKSVDIKINNMLSNQTAFIYNTENNKVLLSFYGNEIYLNVLRQRNKNVYERVGNDLIIKKSI